MLLKRTSKSELMDDFSIQDERIDSALSELRLINYFLGGNNGSKRGVTKLLADFPHKKLMLLDAGSGSSDILDDIKKKQRTIQVISLDKNKRVCSFIKKNNNFKPMVVCGDAFNLPFKEKSVDIIHSSLFLHHLEENQSNAILEHFSKIAKYGIVINDLRRSLRALIGIKFLTLLFSRSELVRNDAPLSVRKGFSKSELVKLMTKTAFSNYEIIRKWAFRWIVIIRIKS